MSNLPLFYQKITPLTRERHGDWRIKPSTSYAFAAQTNSIYVAAIEFGRAAREYPIVFGRGKDESVFPVALLGLKSNENLFVDAKGNWQADYIPAYVRRYPFILAETSDNGESRFTVCLDEDYAGFVRGGKKGQPLFDSDGEQTELLRHSVDFLKDYQGHIQLTTAFCQKLQELDLLEAVRADIALPGGEKQALGGFFRVSRDRLKQLDGASLAELVQADYMESIYLHLRSLDNLDNLVKRSEIARQPPEQSNKEQSGKGQSRSRMN